MAGWPDLPWELLQQIIEKLPILDILRLVLCLSKWWKNFKEQPVPSKVQLPWLLILPLPNIEKPNIASFFDLSRGEVIRISVPLPPFQDRICIGSTGGWMVTVTRKTLEAHLLNPVSGQQIDLPRFRCVSAEEQDEDIDNYFAKCLVHDIDGFFMCSKAVVSWDKKKEIGEVAFTVVIKLYCRACIVVAKEGRPDWQMLQPPQFYEDVMTDAEGKFFLLNPIHRRVDTLRLQHQDYESSLEHLSLHMPQERYLCSSYLAGWFLGDVPEIFILMKNIPPGSCPDMRLDNREPLFKVFKYDKNVDHFKRVYNLGGKSIFVGASNAIVLSLPGLRRDSVYYFDGFNYANDVCVYDIEEHSFQRITIGLLRPFPLRYERCFNAALLDAVWLSPSYE